MSWARSDVDGWVAAGLVLQRGEASSAALIDRARPILAASLDLLTILPPLGVIADIGRLLTRAPFDIAASETVTDPHLRVALDDYEEHVLGRLAADHRLETARDALLRLDPRHRPAATAVFIEQVLSRLSSPTPAELDTPGPAAIRRVIRRPPAELLELGGQVLSPSAHPGLRDELTRAYADLAASARTRGALIGDVELYTLENHEALSAPALRLALAQIAEAGEQVERHLPVRVRRSQMKRGHTPTTVEDESVYPIGGYSSISTIGGIESLVSSELIYMNPPQERAAGTIDLFDLRWAGGELLKYTRDESVYTRERMTLSFVLTPELDDARFKDPSIPFQRIVLLFGGLIAGLRKLCAWLDESELHLHLLLIASPAHARRADPQPLRAEAELARLILREYIESGVVEFFELSDEDAARAHARAAADVGASDLVWLLGGAREPGGDGEQAFREHAISVETERPQLWIEGEAREVKGEGWHAWVAALAELFQGLL